MSSAALARRIKDRGLELGLAAVGIAPIVPSGHAEFLKDWLLAGHSGEMRWMDRTAPERSDLHRRFPWARTAVVATQPYLPYKNDRRRQGGLLPHVARYALGSDYHVVLDRRLRALAKFIEAESNGARTRVYSDTGPVLERELAARAGLGWFGKSTNLIGPGGNSWILLGQILTDLDLPQDSPVSERCGTCTACIDACPTGAITTPYLVDSRRCISYLTIELRGAVPAGMRAEMGEWVFGCDVCQEVCPWNRKTVPVTDEVFLPGRHLEGRSLMDLVRIGEATFRADFGSTALQRSRRQGLVRNAMIVAANVSDGEALEAAEENLADPDPVVRGTAAWAIGRAGGARGRWALLAARKRELVPETRAEIEAALQGEEPVLRPEPALRAIFRGEEDQLPLAQDDAERHLLRRPHP